MACKAYAPHIRYISIGKYLRGYESTVAAQQASIERNKNALMQKAKQLAATSVAQEAASLTNQAGGNIGFTYE